MDYPSVEALRQRHPAWRLLRSDHAALIVAFLHRVFIAPNVRLMAEADLAEALEDQLFALRQMEGPDAYPRTALQYLNDWAEPERGWLRKFYATGSDEARFDLTPATEKAIRWLASLTERAFVGTESRLLTLFALLEQIDAGTETDPQRRLEELRSRRAAIDVEIARISAGDLPLLDDTAIRDRFQQFQQLARELLADFREVEHNFRSLDRRVRERIALWSGSKGELLDQIMGERDAISQSDQGRSFRAFWDFLMSSRRQQELGERLERALALPAVSALEPDPRLRRVHHDWLEAAEYTQRTVAQLSQQLRRFLDDRAWLENRRIIELLQSIETHALALRDQAPAGPIHQIDEPAARISLPFERPLHAPSMALQLRPLSPDTGSGDDIDTATLFFQVVVDRERLELAIRQALRRTAQVSLPQLLAQAPLEQGLAELVGYLRLAHPAEGEAITVAGFRALVDETVCDTVEWQATDAAGESITRSARLPRLIFLR
jgi:hypothetical protein